MKKILYVLRGILLTPFALLYFLFGTLWHALTAPFKSGAYRKSHFARDTGARYVPGICEEEVYKLYNRLRDAELPVEVVSSTNSPDEAHIVWNNTLIIADLIRVHFLNGQWVIAPGQEWKTDLPIKQIIAEELDDIFDDRPGIEIDDAVILLRRGWQSPAELPRMEQTPMFLLYDNDPTPVLKDFIETKSKSS